MTAPGRALIAPGELDAELVADALGASPREPLAFGDLRGATAAAVMVLIAFDPEPSVITLLRASHLREHAGEIGFPGGKPDPGDRDLTATAYRETEEEIGVSSGEARLLGHLSPVPVIGRRYVIHPFVAALAQAARPRVASPEVERLLVWPIVPLLTGDAPIFAYRSPFHGGEVLAPHFRQGAHVLYGASSFIFYELLALLAARLGRALPAPHVEAELPWGDRYAKYTSGGRKSDGS